MKNETASENANNVKTILQTLLKGTYAWKPVKVSLGQKWSADYLCLYLWTLFLDLCNFSLIFWLFVVLWNLIYS